MVFGTNCQCTGSGLELRSVVDIVPPMAGTIVPEIAVISHGGEALDLQNPHGVWAGISSGGWSEGRKHARCLGSRGSEGAVWDPKSLGCGTQPFISKAWRRPQVFSSDPKIRRSQGTSHGRG